MSAENDKKCMDYQGDSPSQGTRLKSLSLRCNIWHPIVTTGQTRGVSKVAKGLRSDNVAHIRGLQPIKMEANTTHYDKPATPKEEQANQERDIAEASGQSYFFFVVGAQVKQSHGAVWSAVCSQCHLWGRAGLLHTGHPQT